jgi:hypothetical protein
MVYSMNSLAENAMNTKAEAAFAATGSENLSPRSWE